MRLRHVSAGLLLLGLACAPPNDMSNRPLVVRVPPGMETQAREVADTLLTFHGAPVDSIAYSEDRHLRVTLHQGVYLQPMTFRDGQCGGGLVPVPALLRLGEVAFRVFGSPDSVVVVEIASSGNSVEVSSILGGSRSCSGFKGTTYYRPQRPAPG